MTLAAADLEQIGGYVRTHLAAWVREAGVDLEDSLEQAHRREFEAELRERIVRVEEGLLHQRELMQAGFARMDRRFEQMDRRFEQMEQRFEQVERRFEQVTARIDRFMVWSFGVTITVGGIVIGVLKAWP